MAISNKYTLEDQFDFYKALNDSDDVPAVENICISGNINTSGNICMISHFPLSFNSVTLPCKHSFNYIPLYTELCIHHNYRIIRCPYCRTEFDKFIPFIPLPNVKRVIGVNSPEKKCMPAPKCQYMLKSGINKGKICHINGMECEAGIFCMKHLAEHTAKAKASATATATATASATTAVWTTEMNDFSKTKTVVELRKMLREKGLKVGGSKKELVLRLFL